MNTNIHSSAENVHSIPIIYFEMTMKTCIWAPIVANSDSVSFNTDDE